MITTFMFWVKIMSIKSFFTGFMSADKTIEALGSAIDKNVTSDEERLAGRAIIEKLKLKPLEFQQELNKLEAVSSGLFKGGWRPFIGWVCGLSLLFYYVPQFVIGAVVWVISINHSGWAVIPAYPVDASSLLELVLAMLGMAAYRTYEKKNGLA